MSNSTVSIASANLSAFIKECLDNPLWVKDKFLGLGIDLVGLTIEQLNSLSEAEQEEIGWKKFKEDFEKKQTHRQTDIDVTSMTANEQLAAYADIIGWKEGEVRYIMVRKPYRTKEGEEKSTLVPHKCTNLGNGKLRIVPQQAAIENGKTKKDGTCTIWKDCGTGIKSDISYFNHSVKDGAYTNTGIKFNQLDGGIGSKHFVSSSCFVFENDRLNLEQQKERANWLSEETGIDSSIIFTGGKSYHVYISLDTPIKSTERWEYGQQLLISLALSDTAIKNTDRETRPPLTLRRKGEEIKECCLVKFSQQKYCPEFVIDQLEKLFLKVYGVDPKELSSDEWSQLYSRIQKAINAGTSEHEQIKELVNAPIKPKKEATPLLPELKQAAREEVAKRKNGGYYPFNAFLSKDTRSLLDSPVGEGSRHAYLYKLSIRIHQAKNACEEFGIPIEPGEPEDLFRFAVGNNIEGDYPEWEAERDWEQGASKAEQYPYPGGEERLLRITGWIDEVDGFGVPTEIIEDEDSEKSEEQIKAERQKRDFKYWTKLNALGEYKGKNVNYTHTNFDLHCYKQETKKIIKPGVVNVLIAKPGLGKSELARDIGLESNSVLALSPLTSLSKKFASDEWQLDYKDREIKYSNPEAAIFREVHTYKTFTWYFEHVLAQIKALIFFDEFVQGIKQVLGTKGRGIFQPWERQAWITHFKNLVETAARSGNTIIIASNDITDIYIEFIRQNISDDIEINVIINDYIPNRPPIKFYTDQKPEGFLLKHEQALAKTWNAQTNSPDGCVLFFSDHKGGRKGSSINAKSITKKHPKWSNFILDANRDTKENEPVQFFFVDPNSEITKYLAVFFSNVVVNGISMTNGWANSIYCLVNGIDSPEDVHQKILRERTAQDINIWVADRNTQGTDCPYVNWQHVRSFRIKRYKQNSAIQRDALNGLGIKFDVPSQEYKSSPAIDLSCKITALENLKNRHLREYTKLYLEQSGYTVQEVNTEFTKPEEEGKKFQNDVVIFEQDYSEAIATDNAEDLEAEAVEACKDDPAYRYAIAKYFLKKKYPPNFNEGYGGIEITNPETGDKIKLEGLAGIAWLENKLKLANKFDRGYMVLFAKDIDPVVEDLKNEASILKDYKFNNVKRELMPDDHSTLSLEITTLRSLNLGELIDKLEPGTSLDENSKAVEEFCSKVKALNTKQSLNVTVKPNARPKDILNKIIEGKLGLPIESERKRQGKAQPYLYYIKPEYLAWFYLFCECKQAERKSEYRLEYLVEQVANP